MANLRVRGLPLTSSIGARTAAIKAAMDAKYSYLKEQNNNNKPVGGSAASNSGTATTSDNNGNSQAPATAADNGRDRVILFPGDEPIEIRRADEAAPASGEGNRELLMDAARLAAQRAYAANRERVPDIARGFIEERLGDPVDVDDFRRRFRRTALDAATRLFRPRGDDVVKETNRAEYPEAGEPEREELENVPKQGVIAEYPEAGEPEREELENVPEQGVIGEDAASVIRDRIIAEGRAFNAPGETRRALEANQRIWEAQQRAEQRVLLGDAYGYDNAMARAAGGTERTDNPPFNLTAPGYGDDYGTLRRRLIDTAARLGGEREALRETDADREPLGVPRPASQLAGVEARFAEQLERDEAMRGATPQETAEMALARARLAMGADWVSPRMRDEAPGSVRSPGSEISTFARRSIISRGILGA